ncbi:hypothetical protein K1719_016407 [Acacia pycnantha]|nr:hypothetical protein K1719_016407 [Acacia pycnantha]
MWRPPFVGLQKRPAPPRFGRKLTEAQKARATHIYLDCGCIYTLQKPLEEQAQNFTFGKHFKRFEGAQRTPILY